MKRYLSVFLFFAGCELLSLNESSADSLELETTKDDSESSNKDKYRIFFTKDLKGFIDICGCSEDMAGGLPRIASLKSRYQNSIWVDLGNWAHDEDHKDPVPEVTSEIMNSFFNDYVRYDIIVDDFSNTNNDLQSVIFDLEDNQNQVRFTYIPKDNNL